MLADVTVIGGGIIGTALARALTRYRLEVVLVEKEYEVGWGTTKANSGIIHAGHRSKTGTLKGELEWAGNQMWDELAAQLHFGFKRQGELTLALDDSDVAVLHKLLKQGQERGVPGLEIWDKERVLQEEPNVTPDVKAALYAPTSGVVNPYEACCAMAENARRNGLHLWVGAAVTGFVVNEDSIEVQTERGNIRSKYVVNAAGIQADRIAAMAGAEPFELVARKGEEYLLDKDMAGIVSRTLFPCPSPTSKGILVIPTVDGTIMCGPTAQVTEDREDFSTTPEGFKEVFTAVQRLVPAIAPREGIAQFAGLRAVSATEDFIIGPTSLRGFINAAGIQSPGLTAAPAIAEMLVKILQDEGLELTPNSDFQPDLPLVPKFAEASPDEQRQLIEEDPRYGRIVCRCEQVTEREVIAAIENGARTLDGIKFRTRAGMGRCQGGFCASRCMELLSQELRVPLTELTKRGSGSWLLRPRVEVDEQTRGGKENA